MDEPATIPLSQVDRFRVACIVTSAFGFAAAVISVGALTPGYRPWADTVSRLGSPGQPLALVARASLALYGILVIVGARALAKHAPGRRQLLAGLIRLYGAAAILAGCAPKDAPGTASTMVSHVHVAATIVGGTAIVLAMMLVATRAAHPTVRRTTATVATTTCFMVIVFKLSWGSPIYGLAERILLALPAFWLVTLATCRPGRHPPRLSELSSV